MAARATKAEIKRALDAWVEADHKPLGGYEVAPDGTIRVFALMDKRDKDPLPSEGLTPWEDD